MRLAEDLVFKTSTMDSPFSPREPTTDDVGHDDLRREIRTAVEHALIEPSPESALERLRIDGLLVAALPEVEALVTLVPPAGVHHKNLWEHTVQVVAGCPPRGSLRWAALLHDIGKVPTRQVDPGGGVTFHGHEEAGARMVERDIAPRLGFAPDLTERVTRLVRNHHRAAVFTQEWTESAVGRLCRDLGEQVEDLLALARADVTSRFEERRIEAYARVDALASRILAWRDAQSRPRLLPPGIGHLLKERFGLPPGPQVGRLRRRLEEALQGGALPLGAGPEECLRFLAESESLVDGPTEAPSADPRDDQRTRRGSG